MNKQEQKNKLWALKWIDKEIEENERHAHQKTGTEANTAYWKGYIASCKNIRYIVKELDELQKAVVPKFVAEWFEENKDDLEFAIWELCVDSYGSAEQGMLNWIQQSENNPIETLIRMKDGYEVEKVQKYIVKIGKLYLKEPLGDTSNFTILTTWDKKRAYPFSSFNMADKHADKFEGAVVEEAEG